MKLFLFITLNYFSVYSLVPNREAIALRAPAKLIAREEYNRPLKTKYIPHPNAPRSIHQKYWREKYRDIYPVNLVERDWSREVQKIIDLQPAQAKAPEIVKPKDDSESSKMKQKPQGFKRPSGKRQSKSLF